ncbi:MAG: GGDEF domain-containing protein [Methylorubrum populi]
MLIQVSLFEGLLVEVLLALLMAAVVRRRREEAMTALAERDPLTGAFNRRAFESRAAGILSMAAGGRRRPGALLLLDIDRFKTINDTYGHAVGDRILVALTGVLEACLPREAVLARLGGDEFVILLPESDEAAVQDLGAAIRVRMAREGGRGLPTGATVSLGAALFGGGPAGLDALMALADTALYEAKARGRDRLRLRRLEPPVARAAGGRMPEPASARLSSETGCCA